MNGIFDPPIDYRFPLTRFTLNLANPDGTPGTLVAVSPKTDYCITADTYVGGVPHTPNQTSPPQGNCGTPTKLLGFSVGWGDEYDQTDNGQPIDLTGVPDGTYVLRATVDPQHVFTESDSTNNVVDTELQITSNSVTVLSQDSPATVPPTIALTSPAAGAQVNGIATLSAMATASAPATVTSVQYLLDGEPLGPPVTDDALCRLVDGGQHTDRCSHPQCSGDRLERHRGHRTGGECERRPQQLGWPVDRHLDHPGRPERGVHHHVLHHKWSGTPSWRSSAWTVQQTGIRPPRSAVQASRGTS